MDFMGAIFDVRTDTFAHREGTLNGTERAPKRGRGTRGRKKRAELWRLAETRENIYGARGPQSIDELVFTYLQHCGSGPKKWPIRGEGWLKGARTVGSAQAPPFFVPSFTARLEAWRNASIVRGGGGGDMNET